MPRSIHATAPVVFLLTACAQSQPPSTTAPLTSASTTSNSPEPIVAASAPPPTPDTSLPSTPPVDEAGAVASTPGVDPRFRACQADTDCVAVRRAGCCYNGWKEAVATSQADAYSQANACAKARRPPCPMYIVRDMRVARCDTATHLCTMVQP
jgi:hypothetical protein